LGKQGALCLGYWACRLKRKSLSSIQAGEVGAPIDSEAWKPFRLRVFNQQRQLVAIAQAIVPRVFQRIVVLPAPA